MSDRTRRVDHLLQEEISAIIQRSTPPPPPDLPCAERPLMVCCPGDIVPGAKVPGAKVPGCTPVGPPNGLPEVASPPPGTMLIPPIVPPALVWPEWVGGRCSPGVG